jgi:hypothetical protein
MKRMFGHARCAPVVVALAGAWALSLPACGDRMGGQASGGAGGTAVPGGSGGRSGGPDGGGPDGVGGGGCGQAAVVTCQGNAVVRRDPCSMNDTVLAICTSECFQGQCTQCLPATGLVCLGDAVHPVDSCGNVAPAPRETCPSGCSGGRCVPRTCTPRASLRCVENLLFSVDSCGNLGNVEQVCQAGCANGACAGCTPNTSTTCYNGDVYNVSSCLQIGERHTDCPGTCRATMRDGTYLVECISDPTACVPNAGVTSRSATSTMSTAAATSRRRSSGSARTGATPRAADPASRR